MFFENNEKSNTGKLLVRFEKHGKVLEKSIK